MTLDLDPIRARLAAATPGPWERMPAEVSDTRPADCYDVWGGDDWLCASVHHTNADLIAHAPADLAALVAEVERLRETVQRVREMHQPRPYADDDLRAVAPSLPEFVCDHCRGKSDSAVPYPCPTLRALDGAE